MLKRTISILLTAALIFLSAGLLGGGVLRDGTLPGELYPAEEYVFELSEVPEYSGSPWTELNGGRPVFSDELMGTASFERYGELDRLGRCTAALANIGSDLMPDGPRQSISSVRPSGWHLVRYEELGSDLYLYNRCHLIARQLTGEDANERNLITGTRYMNVQGLLPFENKVADYVKNTGNHVLYRAEPVFSGSDLLCRGVHLEALSVEDGGVGVCFNVFAYNVQPGIIIDYSDGSSRSDGSYAASKEAERSESGSGGSSGAGDREASEGEDGGTGSSREYRTQADYGGRYPEGIAVCEPASAHYVLNLNTGKFHYPGCDSVSVMSVKNKYYTDGAREAIIEAGYDPCRICRP